jgi:S1-C subfamily serine protease
MKHLARTLGATIVVSVSMAMGAVLALAYAWFAAPAPLGGVLPVRWETPLSRGGEVTKAILFDEQEVMALYQRVAPAVVAIRSVSGQRNMAGIGSGVIVDPSGVVLTNYHVVRGARRIDVILSDRTQFTARVHGTDPQDDLAVLRLVDAPGGLPSLPFGDSDSVRPGALAVAVGNPAGYERSITVGVISGLNRTLREADRPPLRNVLQTDAAINPGNSGGPLLNAQGEVVGITTAIERVPGQPGFGGIGFAVPASTVVRYLDRMLAGETIQHPWLGIGGSDVTPSVARERRLGVQHGVIIESTVADGPAQAAGLQAGDVLLAMDGRPIHSMDELGEVMERGYRPGDVITLSLLRAGQPSEQPVTLGTWPERLPPAQ